MRVNYVAYQRVEVVKPMRRVAVPLVRPGAGHGIVDEVRYVFTDGELRRPGNRRDPVRAREMRGVVALVGRAAVVVFAPAALRLFGEGVRLTPPGFAACVDE